MGGPLGPQPRIGRMVPRNPGIRHRVTGVGGRAAAPYNSGMRRSAALAALALSGCATSPSPSPVVRHQDLHSFARPHEVRSTHLELDLKLDFAAHTASGSVVHHLDREDPTAPLVLDWDGLVLHGATDQRGEPLTTSFGPQDPHLGQALTVDLRPDTTAVRIAYQTAPDAEAMQWLAPEQTLGGTQPFLFTQGQAILTRTWIPLQDSPAVRTTWQATIHAPTGLVPIMSADQREWQGSTGRFAMTKPVPSYLIALACGDLTSRALSSRAAVWAEPATIDLAAQEFADTEAMIVACERLFGPYRWGRYDVLVLPPSFPFGGMENPCLTFATPTILAGDKSLVALIAHELAHSWSGNLVTNATWRDFWLNEGFTVYLENRIMEEVFGRPRAAMEIVLGVQGLRDELASLPTADQRLYIDLAGRNPDDGMTQVPYEKGAAFLRRVEQAVGRPRMDAFLRRWFDAHAFTSVTTAQFVDFLDHQLRAGGEPAVLAIDVAQWLFEAGLPADAPVPDSELFAQVEVALASWREGTAAADLPTNAWVTQQWLRFLRGLGTPTTAQLAALDQAFALTRSGNSEILAQWLEIAVRAGYPAVDRRLELFLMSVGRRKFLIPLYTAILAGEGGKARALAIYQRARPRYHAVAQRSLDQLLGYQPGK